MFVSARRNYRQKLRKYTWKLNDRKKMYIRFTSKKFAHHLGWNKGNSFVFNVKLNDSSPDRPIMRASKIPSKPLEAFTAANDEEMPKKITSRDVAIEQVKLEAAQIALNQVTSRQYNSATVTLLIICVTLIVILTVSLIIVICYFRKVKKFERENEVKEKRHGEEFAIDSKDHDVMNSKFKAHMRDNSQTAEFQLGGGDVVFGQNIPHQYEGTPELQRKMNTSNLTGFGMQSYDNCNSKTKWIQGKDSVH